MFIDAPSFVIQRRIQCSLAEVQRGLADRTPLAPTRRVALEPDGFLHIDEPFNPVTPFSSRQPAPSWRTSAVLLTPRNQVVARVELSVSMWAQGASELQIRPDARHPQRWSSRRVHRYFALAHSSADEVGRLLVLRAHAEIDDTKGAARRVRVWGREPLRAAAGDVTASRRA